METSAYVSPKRMASRHQLHEDALDGLSRRETFVDLHAVARQSMVLSVESYSIKKLEAFYRYERAAELTDVRPALNEVEWAIEMGGVDQLDPQTLDLVAAYNQDDCVSTLKLHRWLEEQREIASSEHGELPRPPVSTDQRKPETLERQAAFIELRDQLKQLAGDYLLIDEAGQMSLAMALAAMRAAKNVILLGDPQQLKQAQRAAHPEGSDVAALAHLMQDGSTIGETRGIFLADSYRLHPDVCKFTSEQFYEGRYQSEPECQNLAIIGDGPLSGTGLRLVQVEHVGNQNRSDEKTRGRKYWTRGRPRRYAKRFPPPANQLSPPMSRTILAVATLLCVTSPLRADVDYEADIKPIFQEKCGACHGVLQQEAGLRLDAGALIRGEDAPNGILDLDDPAASLLIERVTATDIDERMPPAEQGTPLTDQQVQHLLRWIELGAPSPADEVIMDSPSEHWAYQSPVKSELPTDVPEPWAANPIDSLIFDEWRNAKLVPIGFADSATILRRLHFDVTGLPPAIEDQRFFLTDPSDDAWRERVDRLLADPAYGENWARYWMDVWRYSDWDGYKDELRGSQRHIWHWRDWIVESLNADKGYDAMTREMIAGDEIEPENLDVLRATGFLVRNFHKSNRDIWLDATVEHTAKAFLGMTIACARCHDHKYDPISQREYYALRAIFEPHQVRTERLPGQADTNQQGLPRAYDADLNAPTYLYVSGNEKNPDKDHPLDPALPEIISVPYQVRSVDLPRIASNPFLREYIESEELAEASSSLNAMKATLAAINSDQNAGEVQVAIARQQVTVAEASMESLKRRWDASRTKLSDEATAANLAMEAANAERIFHFQSSLLELLKQRDILAKADQSNPSDAKKKKAAIDAAKKKLSKAEKTLVDASANLVATDGNFTPVGTSYPTTSSGRRTALADWITHPHNPLTARVAINHIWLHYFGEPLVQSVDDFGLRAPPPVHQKVLDWLAIELMEHQWSMKHIHRLILNSRLYRVTSSATPTSVAAFADNSKIDPDNLHIWRANIRRLNAEQVRDSLLAVAGTLDRTMGGADIDFRDGETTLRRSLYFRHAYEKQMRMLVVFDAANPTDCYRRSESVVPQQSLALANSPLAIDQSRRAATRVTREASDNSDFIQRSYVLILGRQVTNDEMTACEKFLDRQTQLLSNPNQLENLASTAKTTVAAATDATGRARENLIHVLINHNDFVTVR